MFRSEQLEKLNSMSEIASLYWKDFEWFTKFFLEKRGHTNVLVTKKHGKLGGDGGVDVTSVFQGEKFHTQCKRWNPSFKGTFKGLLPVHVVRELGGCMLRDDVHRGIVMTTLRYESLDLSEATKMKIELIGRDEILNAMKEINPYFEKLTLRRLLRMPLNILRWIFVLFVDALFI